MSKKFTNVDQYTQQAETLWNMIGHQEYWQAKYEALDATEIKFLEFSSDDTHMHLKSIRSVPANLPSFAKKILGERNVVTQTEDYSWDGAVSHGKVHIDVKGAPGGTDGLLWIRPSGSGCEWAADFDIKITLPVIGGKLESVMHKETASQFRQEKVFNDKHLRELGH